MGNIFHDVSPLKNSINAAGPHIKLFVFILSLADLRKALNPALKDIPS